jgi:hypothetical protein
MITKSEGCKCDFCGRIEEKAFVDHENNKYHDGLTWLYPDERWICSSCLLRRSTLF